jgi:hypothetical protein
MTDELRPTLIRKARVVRMEQQCAPTIAVGFEDRDGEQWFFALADADAYDLMRRMNVVLFDADPPRSGVGSPGHTA